MVTISLEAVLLGILAMVMMVIIVGHFVLSSRRLSLKTKTVVTLALLVALILLNAIRAGFWAGRSL
jgi:hypothetical protein